MRSGTITLTSANTDYAGPSVNGYAIEVQADKDAAGTITIGGKEDTTKAYQMVVGGTAPRILLAGDLSNFVFRSTSAGDKVNYLVTW